MSSVLVPTPEVQYVPLSKLHAGSNIYGPSRSKSTADIVIDSVDTIYSLPPLDVLPDGSILAGERRFTKATEFVMKFHDPDRVMVPVRVHDVAEDRKAQVVIATNENERRRNASILEQIHAYSAAIEAGFTARDASALFMNKSGKPQTSSWGSIISKLASAIKISSKFRKLIESEASVDIRELYDLAQIGYARHELNKILSSDNPEFDSDAVLKAQLDGVANDFMNIAGFKSRDFRQNLLTKLVEETAVAKAAPKGAEPASGEEDTEGKKGKKGKANVETSSDGAVNGEVTTLGTVEGADEEDDSGNSEGNEPEWVSGKGKKNVASATVPVKRRGRKKKPQGPQYLSSSKLVALLDESEAIVRENKEKYSLKNFQTFRRVVMALVEAGKDASWLAKRFPASE